MHTTIRQTICLWTALLVSLAGLGIGQAAPPPASPDFAAIDAYVEAQRQGARIPGIAIGIVESGQIVHLAGFGTAGPSGQPVTPQTPLLIGSLSKSFTALAVMQLVEAGQLDLDTTVQTYAVFAGNYSGVGRILTAKTAKDAKDS